MLETIGEQHSGSSRVEVLAIALEVRCVQGLGLLLIELPKVQVPKLLFQQAY